MPEIQQKLNDQGIHKITNNRGSSLTSIFKVKSFTVEWDLRDHQVQLHTHSGISYTPLITDDNSATVTLIFLKSNLFN